MMVQFRDQEKHDKEAARSGSTPAIPVPRLMADPSPKKVLNKAVKREQDRARKLQPRLERWLRLLAEPFENASCKVPINYNPVPSFMTSVARTSALTYSWSVAGNTTTQIAIVPGHGIASEVEPMDGVAYHARKQIVNTTTYTVGPMGDGVHGSMCGVHRTGLTTGTSNMYCNTVNDTPITYSNQLPYTASEGESGHSRWKLAACGIRIQNVTPELTRGGNVSSVQPSSVTPIAVTNQDYFTSNPSFQISEKANTGVLEISWIPRPEDLAYWHSIRTSTETAYSGVNYAGLFVWLNNPTSGAQSYAVDFVFHWELGGTSLQTVSSPSVHQPADKNVLEPSLDITRFTKPSSSGILNTAYEVVKHVSPFMEKALKDPRVSSAAKFALGAAPASSLVASLLG